MTNDFYTRQIKILANALKDKNTINYIIKELESNDSPIDLDTLCLLTVDDENVIVIDLQGWEGIIFTLKSKIGNLENQKLDLELKCSLRSILEIFKKVEKLL